MAKLELTVTATSGTLDVTPDAPVVLTVLESVGPRGPRGLISVDDTGGDGSLTYDFGSGELTYTGPSAAEVRAHFSGGTGVTITDGEVAIGQAVGTSDDVTFNDVTINGDLNAEATFVDTIDINNVQETSATQITLSTTSATSVASFNGSTFNCGKMIIQVKDNVTSEVQVSQISVAHNTYNAHTTEYSNLFTSTNPLATFAADIRSGSVHIDATAASSNSTTYKVLKTLIRA